MKSRVISFMLALCILFTGCGAANTGDTTVGMNTENSEATTEEASDVSVEPEDVDAVGTPSEYDTTIDTDAETDTEDADTTENVESEVEEPEVVEPQLTEEQKLWQTRIIANAKNNLNVRAEASKDAAIVGKLDRGDYGEILERGSEWTKIKSGNVEGYVANQYCLFGDEAMAQAKELAKTMATVTAGVLRVRKDMSTDSKIITKVEKGEKIEVNQDVETNDGWVAVIFDENTYYMSSEYVSVDVELSVGKTMDEIKEEQRKEEEKKKAEAAAKRKEQEKEILANASDVELLAALIYCEAGHQPYAGKLAVGACVMNRMKHKNYPDTLRGVIYQKGQFSPARSGKLMKVLKGKKANAECIKAAKEALAGVDNTNGCRSFRLASTGRKGLVIGDIVFF